MRSAERRSISVWPFKRDDQQGTHESGTRKTRRTTETHLTTHAEARFHHLAHALIAENSAEPSRQAVPQHVEDLEQHDFVGDAVARLELAMRPGGRELGHGEGEVGRGGVEDGVGDELVDGREGGGGNRSRGLWRADNFEEGVQEDKSVEVGRVCWASRCQRTHRAVYRTKGSPSTSRNSILSAMNPPINPVAFPAALPLPASLPLDPPWPGIPSIPCTRAAEFAE